MKRRALITALTLIVSMGCSVLTNGEEIKTVSLTKEDKIEYSSNNNLLGKAFEGMAPGDSRTITFKLANQSNHEASFFISGETKKALEDINTSARGGAYELALLVGESSQKAVSLINMIAGGYTEAAQGMNASAAGLYEIKGLEGYQFVTKLGKGDSTNLYLTLTLNGEGMDSTNVVDYSNAVGQLSFQFRAYYEVKEPVVVKQEVIKKGEDTVVTKVINRVISTTGRVKTGDSPMVIVLGGVFLAGLATVIVALVKRKVEHIEE